MLHGASTVMPEYVDLINRFGGRMEAAVGISEEQLRRAARSAVCKINTGADDSAALAMVRGLVTGRNFQAGRLKILLCPGRVQAPAEDIAWGLGPGFRDLLSSGMGRIRQDLYEKQVLMERRRPRLCRFSCFVVIYQHDNFWQWLLTGARGRTDDSKEKPVCNTPKILYRLALLFIPLTILLDRMGGIPQPLLFFLAAVSIFPSACCLVHATEQLATYTGDTIGGLLNATFGNAPELIIAMVALKAGLYDMVKASIIGAILANMLLGLGLAFLFGGYRRHVQEFNPVAARNYMTMMLLAVISLAVPSTFHNFVTADSIQHEQYVNLAVALVLLTTYGLSLIFMLQTHPDFFESLGDAAEHGSETRWSLSRAIATLLLTSVSWPS